jgi:hypothetical protein
MRLYFGSALALSLSACSGPLDLGTDLMWTADQETHDLEQWTAGELGGTRLPPDTSIEVTSERARSGSYSLKLVNPTGWNPNERPVDDRKIVDEGNEGPELFRVVGDLSDAYYSAWFLLPEQYVLDPMLTLLRLREQAEPGETPTGGEALVIRSLKTGGYVLQVLSNHANFLLEPVAEPPPHIEVGRWFQLEARYEPRSSGRLRVWLDGVLSYDLMGRPGAPTGKLTLSVSNVVERAEPQPLVLYADDAAISLSRVSPSGVFQD